MIKIYKKSNKGFTLAEVLVTLAIIGVVAALTIPSLIHSYQKQTWSTGYKEAYNIVENATKMVMNANEDSLINAWGTGNNNQLMYEAYEPYLQITKRCENIAPNGTCLASNYYYISGEDANAPGETHSVILSNGMSMLFDAQDGSDVVGDVNYIFVDTNGIKGPNIYGKDFHRIMITIGNSPVKPQNYNVGAGNVILYCPDDLKTSAATFVGRTCGWRILRGDYAKNY